MTNDPKDGAPPSNESTRVDLGDDLLEKTVQLSRESSGARPTDQDTEAILRPSTPAEIEDQVQSAKILLSEGLMEEAKRVLHRILIVDPKHVVARQTLHEIHESELKQIFGEDRKRISLRDKPEPVLTDADADEIMRELDRELSLGIFGRDGGDDGSDAREMAEFPLLSDPKAIQEYATQLEKELVGVSGQDRVDLGIGFLEMGLNELATRQFKSAVHQLMQDPEENAKEVLSATALLAYSTILIGKAFEATLMIQSILRDAQLSDEHKIEFFYLIGRAYEAMRKPDLAQRWYEQVRLMDSNYRDIQQRLKAKRPG